MKQKNINISMLCLDDFDIIFVVIIVISMRQQNKPTMNVIAQLLKHYKIYVRLCSSVSFILLKRKSREKEKKNKNQRTAKDIP